MAAYRKEGNFEKPASTFNGLFMLLVLLGLVALLVFAILGLRSPAVAVTAGVAFVFVAGGFFMLQPNEAGVLTLFGDYSGTERTPGLRWTWPWMIRKKVSVRARNHNVDTLKVNDKRGNPVEIAAVVVWRVEDTAQALFDVDDFENFVHVQSESALRHVATRYNYDEGEAHDEGEITLRAGADIVADALCAELQARVQLAGVKVEEAKLTHLAYAAGDRGCHAAPPAGRGGDRARSKIVTGAVTMVEMALKQLSEKNVVELDDERRAAMVSNLMVVLCSERDTQPIVNAGTLYP